MVITIANSGVSIQLSKYATIGHRPCIVEILATEPGLIFLSPFLRQSSTFIDGLA